MLRKRNAQFLLLPACVALCFGLFVFLSGKKTSDFETEAVASVGAKAPYSEPKKDPGQSSSDSDSNEAALTETVDLGNTTDEYFEPASIERTPILDSADLADAGTPVSPRGVLETNATLSVPSDRDASEDLIPTFWALGSPSFSTSVQDFIHYGSDFERVWNGTASVRIEAKQPIDRAATAGIFQISSANDFADKRLKYSGRLIVKSFSGFDSASAMIWFRADDKAGRVLAFQNTLGRLRFSELTWREASIVIDVPPKAYSIHFGASLVGSGTVWVDSLSLEVVSDDIEPTAKPYSLVTFNRVPDQAILLDQPTNLDFEVTRQRPER